jgi:hypothetical protein
MRGLDPRIHADMPRLKTTVPHRMDCQEFGDHSIVIMWSWFKDQPSTSNLKPVTRGCRDQHHEDHRDQECESVLIQSLHGQVFLPALE